MHVHKKTFFLAFIMVLSVGLTLNPAQTATRTTNNTKTDAQTSFPSTWGGLQVKDVMTFQYLSNYSYSQFLDPNNYSSPFLVNESTLTVFILSLNPVSLQMQTNGSTGFFITTNQYNFIVDSTQLTQNVLNTTSTTTTLNATTPMGYATATYNNNGYLTYLYNPVSNSTQSWYSFTLLSYKHYKNSWGVTNGIEFNYTVTQTNVSSTGLSTMGSYFNPIFGGSVNLTSGNLVKLEVNSVDTINKANLSMVLSNGTTIPIPDSSYFLLSMNQMASYQAQNDSTYSQLFTTTSTNITVMYDTSFGLIDSTFNQSNGLLLKLNGLLNISGSDIIFDVDFGYTPQQTISVTGSNYFPFALKTGATMEYQITTNTTAPYHYFWSDNSNNNLYFQNGSQVQVVLENVNQSFSSNMGTIYAPLFNVTIGQNSSLEPQFLSLYMVSPNLLNYTIAYPSLDLGMGSIVYYTSNTIVYKMQYSYGTGIETWNRSNGVLISVNFVDNASTSAITFNMSLVSFNPSSISFSTPSTNTNTQNTSVSTDTSTNRTTTTVKSSPSFEFISFIFSVPVVVFIRKRKRSS